jgi:UDP-glucose 4-epimerase
MKILVTGGAGFLGSWLISRYVDMGHEVVAVDNFCGGLKENYELVSKRCKFITSDICDLESMKHVCNGMDVVVHAAAAPYEGLSVFSPCFVTGSVYYGSVSVMTAAVVNKVKRFINCSSMARYGRGTLPFMENDIITPADPYGMAKYAAEQTLEILAEKYEMELVTVVPHNIVGPRQNFRDPYRNVISIFINRVLRGLPPIIYGDGEQRRCFSPIEDVLFIFEELLTHPIPSIGEVYNIGPDGNDISINDLAKMVMEACEVQLDPIYVNDRPLEVKYAYCSSDKIRKEFNYAPKKDLKDSIKDTVAFVKACGDISFTYNRELEITDETTPITWTQKLL